MSSIRAGPGGVGASRSGHVGPPKSEFTLLTGCPPFLGRSNYLLWESNLARCQWQDLVTNRVHEAARHFRYEVSTLTQEQQQARRRNAIREIMQQTEDTEEQVRLYRERTHHSRADFFRKKKQVLSGEFDEEDRAAGMGDAA